MVVVVGCGGGDHDDDDDNDIHGTSHAVFTGNYIYSNNYYNYC